MLHRKVLRNAVPRVRSRSVDATVTAALATSGAAAVLTHDVKKAFGSAARVVRNPCSTGTETT